MEHSDIILFIIGLIIGKVLCKVLDVMLLKSQKSKIHN